MFRISDFSRFTRVSVKMLRHYDQLGLLRPARIDPETGYRYYTSEQLPRLNRLIALKDLGFGLEEIGALLNDPLSLDELRGMFRLRQAEIERQVQVEQTRLRHLQARWEALERAMSLSLYDIVVREVPAQLVASIRGALPGDGPELAEWFDELETYVARHAARASSPPQTIYYDEYYSEERVQAEAAVPLAHRIPASERVQVSELPGVSAMACVVYTGGYEQMTEVLAALMRWVEANHCQAAGPLREVYLRFIPDTAIKRGLPNVYLTSERQALVTEVQLPITPGLPLPIATTAMPIRAGPP